MNLKLHVDFLSQPSRACLLFCLLNDLPVEVKKVVISRGGTTSPSYKSKNPLGKVPLLEDESKNFLLPESGAILTYLAERFNVADHWLPKNPEAHARVLAAVHWFQNNVRLGAAGLVYQKVLAPRLGLIPNEEIAEHSLRVLHQALRDLADVWLAHPVGTKDPVFVSGRTDDVCIADLLIACELEQLCLLNYERDDVDMKGILSDHPVVRDYLRRVARACRGNFPPPPPQPEPNVDENGIKEELPPVVQRDHYLEVHALLRKSAALNSVAIPANIPPSYVAKL
uniref:GST N-terminal domain-containing protein n=1 Tax=Polytomella parva TaxID=51329 RepID=A0A7S0VEM9_9CHLO|eukprot:CAMPEP_0175073054 /NCGR_PEP_ID=MMETSP0052_2-20121109/20304_1 /TAXON_ID=51329 ORGANISM="Polytomella parva, Strain SAG 63-3" /NCGR_SAMPLE_ID=MMETSP0052_2 /ASSEMBLY_ACC=CAM_ASM_000194 /LENGTH=282 /DNA_ID=CAMNT_0016340731 /DNA_START=26 /DNA_END=874 /DNA_ORIENTATION=+